VAAEPELLLCDTSYVGHYEKARRDASRYAHWPVETLNRIDAAILGITPFTIGEIRAGYINARWGAARVAAVENQLASYTLIPLDEETLTEYGRLTAHCRSGRAMSDNDRWIAAIAISRELPLITCDGDQCDLPGLEAIHLPPP
jgi:predicted nucleic acid-binding protein